MSSDIESAIQQRLHVIEQQIDAIDAKRFRLKEEHIALYQRYSELITLLQTMRAIEADGATEQPPTIKQPPTSTEK